MLVERVVVALAAQEVLRMVMAKEVMEAQAAVMPVGGRIHPLTDPYQAFMVAAQAAQGLLLK